MALRAFRKTSRSEIAIHRRSRAVALFAAMLLAAAFPARAGVGVVTNIGSDATETPVGQAGAGAPEPTPPIPGVDPNALATLVIYNTADPVSKDLAWFYAEKRKIPADQVVGLTCSLNEEITREEYDETIADPIRKLLTARGWWTTSLELSGTEVRVEENRIRFVALIRGVPLKIAPVQFYSGDQRIGPKPIVLHNEASVDSELSSLGFYSRNISGAFNNPYFKSFVQIRDANLPQVMLVCRLDGPTAEIVRRMITDSIEAEKSGLWGFAYIDARNLSPGDPMVEGDKWLANAASDCRAHGIPVIMDNGPELFPTDYPMRFAALYYGWYSENVTGPFTRDDFRFMKGAIAVHIHSFSGMTVRDEHRYWVGPLLAKGAAATLGNVYEPYLTLTPNLDVFHDRLRNGFTFAESAYMSEKVLSWMTTYVGDPLYRPFNIVETLPEDLPAEAAPWNAYRLGVQTWLRDGKKAGETKMLSAAKSMQSGIVLEGLALLETAGNDIPAALSAYEQAAHYYKVPADIMRVAINDASLLRYLHKNSDALGLIRKELKAHPGAPGAGVLRGFELELAPPGVTPEASPGIPARR